MSYKQYKAKWENCQDCSLCEGRKKVVHARGVLPAKVVFIGEAPGVSEDILGKPFVGPAGNLLDIAIRESGLVVFPAFYTNLVGCFPREAKKTSNHAPPQVAIEACAERLRDLVAIAKPRAIVCVGKLAGHHVKISLQCKETDYLFCDVIHPAAILRMDITQKGLQYQNMVETMRELSNEI